ncbi:hypothetical protein RhiirC2_800816 [Rhizophagus irregularis]|uniref:RRM domain-containing protein n=1 Tax=Rhizophagus irregularis TaxID=588596 RepID=A0A2N1M350_9GLOM|nr:hypothetical protein RhiirC2_800816 [Rhizophagus irregularis]
MTKDNKKKNNKSNNDTTTKRPASSSPTCNVSISAEDFIMDVDKPSTPPGFVEITSTEKPFQPDTFSLNASQHAPAGNNDKGKSPEITPAVSFPEHAAFPNASKAAADEHACTLVVTYIPLFITDALLRGTFSRYGNIIRCHTYLSKLYRTAFITFESTGALQNLDSTWGILCGGHCLCICPATFSPDQRAERRAYVALLAKDGLS